MSRTANSIKNIKYNYIFQTVSLLAAFLSRRVFTRILTAEYLGLNGTFSSILSMLSLAELGIGTAITYSLYQPLAEGDREKIVSLMALYRKAYWVIGLVVAVLGLAVTPFLGVIIADLPGIPRIQLIYLLFVLDTALSYFFIYKQSLISADQKQYIVSAYQQCGKIVLYILQILFLWLTRSYFAYLGLKIISTVCINWLISHRANCMYPWLKETKVNPLDAETKKSIGRNTIAMISHKIGGVVVFGTDNLLMSYFSGVVSVALYSNYTLITGGLNTIYSTLFGSITASIGNLGAADADPKHKETVFNRINFIGSWIYGFSAVCLIALFNPFIQLWVGGDYLLSQTLVVIIAVNFYLTGMRQAALTFRSAFGLYWYDRYKPLAESAINLTASIFLARRIGIEGILIGTGISTITTCFWVEPYMLYKYGFGTSCRPFFVKYFENTFVTVVAGYAMWHLCALLPDGGIIEFALKTVICVVGSNLIFLCVYCRRDEFKYFCRLFCTLIKGKLVDYGKKRKQ